MSIWQHAQVIDPVPHEARISLGEGNTPLIRSRAIGPSVGLQHLWFKLESANPSGSYKDRFAAVAISDMVARGKRTCLATSSGNTGAALAAYCAAAGIPCRIAIVENAPSGKLQQMQAYGAELVRIRGFGTDPQTTERVFAHLLALAEAPASALQISGFKFSPVGMSGVRSLACELADQVPGQVAHVFCPAGGGGLVLAVAQGFARLERDGAPHVAVHCVQPVGNSTIAGPLRNGLTSATPVDCTTAISGLQVASVVDGHAVIAACRRVDGMGFEIPDAMVWQAQRTLAREEGIFAEPAGAISVAAALQAVQQGQLDRNAHVVCLITGSGFKDSASLAQMAGPPCPLVDAEQIPW